MASFEKLMTFEKKQYYQVVLTIFFLVSTIHSFAQIPLKYTKNHDKAIIINIFSPDSKNIACLTADKTIKIYNTETGQLVKVLDDNGEGDVTIAFSPDSKLLAAGSWDKTIKIWDLDKGKITRKLIGHSQATRSIFFNPDGKFIASAGWDRVIKIWYAPTGINLKNLKGHSQCIRSISYSPDGNYIASGGYDLDLKVWDLSNGNLVFSKKAADFPIESISYSPDGTIIATAGLENAIKLWDSKTGDLIKVLRGHTDAVFSISFSPDGKYLVSGGNDNLVKVWKIDQGLCVFDLKGHSLGIRSVSFSPNGKYIVSGAIDKSMKIWDASILHIVPTQTSNSQNIVENKEEIIFWDQPGTNPSFVCSRYVTVIAKINDPDYKNVQLFLNKTEYTKLINNNQEIVKPLSIKVNYNKDIELTYEVYLDNSDNEIQLFAENPDKKNYAFSKPLYIKHIDIEEQVKNCNLRVFMINPEFYYDKKFNSGFEKDNSLKLNGILKTQEGVAYNTVSIINDNSKLSRSTIKNTIDSLVVTTKKNDLYMLFISGIFLKNQENKFFFLTPDANYKSIDSSLIDVEYLCKSLLKTNAFGGLVINASHKLERYPDGYSQINEDELYNAITSCIVTKKDYALLLLSEPENTPLFDIIANSFHPTNDLDNNNVIDFYEVKTFISQLYKIKFRYQGQYIPLFVHDLSK